MQFPLTPRQKRVLDSIRLHAKTKGYMPSVRDLSAMTKSALGTVHGHLKTLERKGWVVIDGTSHGIHLLTGASSASQLHAVPTRGTLTGKGPIRRTANRTEFVHLPSLMAKPGAFGLRIAGDILTSEHILDGDLVVIVPASTVKDGEVALISLDGRVVTLKRASRDWRRVKSPRIAGERGQVPFDGLRVQGKATTLLRVFTP